MKISFEGDIPHIKQQMQQMLTVLSFGLERTTTPSIPLEKIGTGELTESAVEEEQSVTEGVTKFDDEGKVTGKRTRRTKAQIAADNAAKNSDLSDGPANRRPFTQQDIQPAGERPVFVASKEEVVEVPKSQDQSQVSSGSVVDEATLLANFKANFTQTIFLLLQNKVIDQDYIAEKMRYYGLTDLTKMKDDEKMTEHFFKALRVEGKL